MSLFELSQKRVVPVHIKSDVSKLDEGPDININQIKEPIKLKQRGNELI